MDTDSRNCEANKPSVRGFLQVLLRLFYLNKISSPAYQWAVTATMLPPKAKDAGAPVFAETPLLETLSDSQRAMLQSTSL